MELDLEVAKKILNVIGDALGLVGPGVGAYMAATQIRPLTTGGFMGFVSNLAAVPLGPTAGVPGQPNSLKVTVSVKPSGGYDPSNGAKVYTMGQQITFSATVQGGAGPYNYAWEFGDGDTSAAPSPSYTYPSVAGTYEVTLIVTDSQGATGTATFPVEIVSPAP